MERHIASRRHRLLGFAGAETPVPSPVPDPAPPDIDMGNPAPGAQFPAVEAVAASSAPPLAGTLAAGLCFFLSGFSALVFEVIWMRRLHLVLGSTGFAIATVVAAYMGGLALGSYVFGRHAGRFKRPFLVYGLLELGVGAYAIFVPTIFDAAVPLYRWIWDGFHLSFYPFSLLRFLLALAILVVPTTLMGATLPVMSRYLVRNRAKIGSSVGLLYAINTFGAVAGSAVSGFLLLPNLGEWKSLVWAAMGNALIALVVVAYSLLKKGDVLPTAKEEEPAQAAPSAKPAADTRLAVARAAILVAFAGSGVASMSMQVAWSRLLSLLLGSSVYAFSVILTTFLGGLAIGSFISSRIAARVRRPVLWLSVFQAASGVLALVGVFWFNYVFYIFVRIFNSQELESSFGALFLANFVMAALIIFPPTLFMGAAFPMGVRAYARDISALGRNVGEVYSVNTLGAILGSFMGGFVLLPLLGVQHTVETGVVLYCLTAATLAATAPGVSLQLRACLAAPMLLAIPFALFFTPQADPHIMSAGVYKYASTYEDVKSYGQFKRRMAPDRRRLVYYKEGITTTVNVIKFQNQYSIAVNGKIDGSSVGDMHTQLLSGHIPMLFAEDPKKVLVIGYGTGVTVGSIALHRGVTVDCVELEGAVIEAGWFFRHVNQDTDALVADGKVRILKNDGRNILLAARDKWDVIVSEPSNPWISGASKLFTYEFFQTAKARLNEGGVFGQWVQLYGMDDVNVRSLIATFREAFGRIAIFQPSPGADLLLVGRNGGELKVGRRRLESFFKEEAVATNLALVDIKTPEALAAYFLADDDQAASFVARGEKRPPLNTDDNSFIEFNAPRTFFYRGRAHKIQEAIERGYEGPLEVFDGYHGREAASFLARTGEKMMGLREGLARELLERSLSIARTADGIALKARLQWADSLKKTRQALDEGLALEPSNKTCLLRRAMFAWENNDFAGELVWLARAFEKHGDDAEVRYRFALACDNVSGMAADAANTAAGMPLRTPLDSSTVLLALRWGLASRAAGLLEGLASNLESPKDAPQMHHRLGSLLASFGDFEGAEKQFRAHLSWAPFSPSCRRDLADLLRRLGRESEAVQAEGPKNAPETARRVWENAKTMLAEGKMKQAVESMFLAIETAPYEWKIAFDAGMLMRNIGCIEEALEIWRRAMRHFPGHEELATYFAYTAELVAEWADEPGRRAGLYMEASEALFEVARREGNPAQANEYKHRSAELAECARLASEKVTVATLIRRESK